MENTIATLDELRMGVEAGMAAAKSDAFDKEEFEKNMTLAGEWADKVDLEPTVGNVYVIGTIASLRTILGEAFDRPVVDENGDFSEEIMEKVQEELMGFLGLALTDGNDEANHDESAE